MTDTRTYDVHGATLTVTLVLWQHQIEVSLTLDTNALDAAEPDHSNHVLINYVRPHLPNWDAPASYWWCKLRRTLTCRTGAQAARIRQHAVARTEDAVSAALLDRDRRKAEMGVAVAR